MRVYPCGCKAVIDEGLFGIDRAARIVYCPRHAAAPELYEVLAYIELYIAAAELSGIFDSLPPGIRNDIIELYGKAKAALALVDKETT